MSSPSFWKLACTLGKNQIFVSKGKRPQRPVYIQLGTYLICYGQLGSHVVDTALKIGIGRGTVELYTQQVVSAIRKLWDRFGGQWMTEEEIQCVEGAIFETTGFEGYAGSGDGPLVPFTQAPHINGKAFFGCKGFFGVRFMDSHTK
ncbi:hypothetical protein CYLTODRAFT_363349 [Cylindrobasidium torrendii FP15055 ss-10]|uniref:DDE Tnp4 domain-containing protein n=1 Tax=Cylindrobasidium torrendii FP15055 ss-10 TaxID=1314674 RepID=A0A0D7ARU1_9AGAR|nr:hypothetical protein CYLTODRAFT_363349 [Cylindrobasidium torrendii FP15055 ss-10]